MNWVLFLFVFILLIAVIYNFIFSIVIMSPIANKMNKSGEKISNEEKSNFSLAIINLIVSIIIILIILFLFITGKLSGLILSNINEHIDKIKPGDPSWKLLATIANKIRSAAPKQQV